MKYSLIFLSLGISAIALSFNLTIARWLFLWIGASFIIVGAAYAGLGARVLGKRSDGKIAGWAIAFLFLYLFIT